jgi:hypothetical protein
MDQETDDFSIASIKVFILWAIGLIGHNYHVIAGNILVTLSIAYLIWKWWRDYKKSKAEKK